MYILKQHVKTSVRKLKLGCKGVFQMDNDPKHTSKVVADFSLDFYHDVKPRGTEFEGWP